VAKAESWVNVRDSSVIFAYSSKNTNILSPVEQVVELFSSTVIAISQISGTQCLMVYSEGEL
jgi:hypothetical protein